MNDKGIVITNKYLGVIKPGYICRCVIDAGKIIVNEKCTNNCFDYVITKQYEFVIGISHSFLAKGEDVLAVGTITLDTDGSVTEISNESGHYKPSTDESYRAIELLEHLGIDLLGVTINYKKYN